jgi:hypothetical protein
MSLQFNGIFVSHKLFQYCYESIINKITKLYALSINARVDKNFEDYCYGLLITFEDYFIGSKNQMLSY